MAKTTIKKLDEFIQSETNIRDFIYYLFNDVDFYDFTQEEQDELTNIGFISHLMHRNIYIKQIRLSLIEIIQKFCLFIYLYKYDPNNFKFNKEKWLSDLYESVIPIYQRSVPDGDTERTLKYLLYNVYKVDSADEVFKLIEDKFKSYNIDIDNQKEQIYSSINIFQRMLLGNLISIFCRRKHHSLIRSYLENEMLSMI